MPMILMEHPSDLSQICATNEAISDLPVENGGTPPSSQTIEEIEQKEKSRQSNGVVINSNDDFLSLGREDSPPTRKEQTAAKKKVYTRPAKRKATTAPKVPVKKVATDSLQVPEVGKLQQIQLNTTGVVSSQPVTQQNNVRNGVSPLSQSQPLPTISCSSSSSAASSSQPTIQLPTTLQIPQQVTIIRSGGRTILPKPSSSSNVSSSSSTASQSQQTPTSSQQPVAPANPAPSAPTTTVAAPPVVQNIQNIRPVGNPTSSAPQIVGNGQSVFINGQHYVRAPAPAGMVVPGMNGVTGAQIIQNNPIANANPAATGTPIIQQQQQQPQSAQVAYIKTIQTPNGPMQVVILPSGMNVPGIQPMNMNFQQQQSPMQNPIQLNGIPNIIGAPNFILPQQSFMPAPVPVQQPQPPQAQPPAQPTVQNIVETAREPEKSEEMNILEEFLKFDSPATPMHSSATSDTSSIVSDLITFPNSTRVSATPPSSQSVPVVKPKPKRSRSKKKKPEPSDVQQKVKEILTNYKEQVTPAVSASNVPPQASTTVVQQSVPELSFNALVNAAAAPSVAQPPVASVPLKPMKIKTDLGKTREKELKLLETMDLQSPFADKADALHRLLPFHLLSEPMERPEDVRREQETFKLVAQSLVERKASLERWFTKCILAPAMDFVPKTDLLACCQTWLESERAEFEAEKQAVECGMPVDVPEWARSDYPVSSSRSYFDPDYFDLLCNNCLTFLDDLAPPFGEPLPHDSNHHHPSLSSSSSTSTTAIINSDAHETGPSAFVVNRDSRGLKMKIIKRKAVEEPSSVAENKTPVNPTLKVGKFSIKLLKAKVEKSVAVNCEAAASKSLQPAAQAVFEDPTQSAVDSILGFGSPSKYHHMNHSNAANTANGPVHHHYSNGPSSSSMSGFTSDTSSGVSSMMYSYSETSYADTETDQALDEAVNSIL